MSDMAIIVRTEADNYKPVMTIEAVLERQAMIRQYASAVMVEGEDYGVIPGTGTRKVLLKPGAEKLVRIFGLTPRFTDVKIEEDWTGDAHGGEMFFAYTIKCSLYRNECFMGDADGSCNSWEKKYRYASAQRVCPVCGAGAIIAGKKEYGGGFICFDKKGGCKAKFADNDPRITSQSTGQVADPDIADKVNTIRKMAEKRALVAACLITVGASEFFTQDIEPERPQQSAPPAQSRPAPPQRQEAAYEAEYRPHPAEDARPAHIDEDGVVNDPPSRPVLSVRQQALKAFRDAAAAINPAFAAPASFTVTQMSHMVKAILEDGRAWEEVSKDLTAWADATEVLLEFRRKFAWDAETTLKAIQFKYQTKMPMVEFTAGMWENPLPPPAAGSATDARVDAAAMWQAPQEVEA